MKKMLAILSLLMMLGPAQAEQYWVAGISGFVIIGESIKAYPGALVGWSSDIRKYNMATDLTLSWPRESLPYTEQPKDTEYGLVFWSLTMRRSFSDGDITPIVGAGLSVGTIHGDNGRRDGANEGFGAHITFGVDMFRHAKSHLRLEARANFPFYKLSIREVLSNRSNASYIAPISIGISYHR